ncbi:unnamed protein product [Didymodactylos carnosus]|uniref:Uncharacterized protein n=1 Tax=Didymodactylos carnosus TaxID=1234261 RepID=A0A815UZA1_9BILA|nr:unnamed protein product [Didymodactylos carnosus]CAF1520794.1 unnamed protein product [Didymodactylos carnosus]CAF4170337.1 unnamed protein product [Didymodactylos carnosus]CAF4380236.1 unnamed protein product [Didymodactylos carnosus]
MGSCNDRIEPLDVVYCSDIPNPDHLELVWLDYNENLDVEKKLRSFINCLKTFKDLTECERYIREIISPQQCILIVSGGLGKQIVPNLKGLKQVTSVYVFCMDCEKNRQWSKNYDKVRFRKTVEKTQDTLPTSIYNPKCENTGKNLKSENADFMWKQLFIGVLLRMGTNASTIAKSKQYYE